MPLRQKRIAITFQAHKRHLFRPLDIVFFGRKKPQATAVGEFDDESVNAMVTKLIQSEIR
jgi:hypothetical protein